jgi:hypothetical protein
MSDHFGIQDSGSSEFGLERCRLWNVRQDNEQFVAVAVADHGIACKERRLSLICSGD